jgi:hypothetical protein
MLIKVCIAQILGEKMIITSIIINGTIIMKVRNKYY